MVVHDARDMYNLKGKIIHIYEQSGGFHVNV